jgi:hypothetical protein
MPGADILMALDITGSHIGVTTKTRFWLRSKDTAASDDVPTYLQSIMDEFEVFMMSSLQQCCSVDWQLTQMQIEVLAGGDPYQVIKPYTTKFGAQGGDSLPPHDAMLLSFYTQFHSRRLHGRIYVPAVPETGQALGYLIDAHLARLDTFGALLVSRFGLTGNSPNCWVTVFSRRNGVQRQALPIPHLVYDVLAAIPITRTVPHRDIATQRHRKHGRGI